MSTDTIFEGYDTESEARRDAAYRFAVVIDCGKCFGVKPHHFDRQLAELIENTLGVETYDGMDVGPVTTWN